MKKLVRHMVLIAGLSAAGTIPVFAQPRLEVPLTISDGVSTTTLYFGILPGADPCINPRDSINGHYEAFLPPPPPGGVFDARFISPEGRPPLCYDQGSPCDFRPFFRDTQRDTFRFHGQPGTGTTWNICWPLGLSAYFTELTICGINALTASDPCLTGVPSCTIIAAGPHMPVTIQVRAGWNGISNPFDHPIPDSLASSLFPTLIGRIARWSGSSYILGDVMLKGWGCYGRFPAATTVTVRGTGHTSDSIDVSLGWNMVGPPPHPVPVSGIYSIPPDIIVRWFFECLPISRADTLWPGKAYWVKVNQSGLLVMPPRPW